MNIWDTTRRQALLCSEPLEGRCLLSGVALPTATDLDRPFSPAASGGGTSTGSSGGPAQVIDLELEEEEEDDIEVSLSDLPAAVLRAVMEQFPGAKLIEAELGFEDGEAEYGVAARFGGRSIDVTVTPRGEVIETEAVLSKRELPVAALAWVREEFPGAEIDEIAIMFEDGETSYELLIEAADGSSYEAQLRVPGAPELSSVFTGAESAVADDVAIVVPASAEVVAAEAPETGVAEAIPELPAVPTPSELRSQVVAVAQEARLSEEVAASDAGAAPEIPLEQTSGDAVEAVAPNSDSDAGFVQAFLQAAIAAGVPVAWVPQLADVLAEVLPVDVAAVERELASILEELDSLAAAAAGESAASSIAWRIAAVAALIAGAQLLRIESKNPAARLCWSLARPTPLGPKSLGRRRSGGA